MDKKLKAKMLGVAVVALLIAVGLFAATHPLETGPLTNIMNPGPEGVDCHVYAVQDIANLTSNRDLHLTSETLAGTHLSERDILGSDVSDENYWMAKPDPYNTILRQRVHYWSGYETYQNYIVEVGRPTFKEDPSTLEGMIQKIWYSWESAPINASDGSLTWTKYGGWLIPVDVKIQISNRAESPSGSVGAITDYDLWLVFDTVRWYNTYTTQPIFPNDITPEDAILQSFKYRGVIPIFAWIKLWDPFVFVDNQGKQIDINDVPPIAKDEFVQIFPSYEGRQMPMYTNPTTLYQEILSRDVFANPHLITGLQNNVRVIGLDPRFYETMFTPITLVKFGSVYQSWWNPWPFNFQQRWYYPTAYLQIRLLTFVWGEWAYLWTQEEAEKQGYEWTNRTSSVTEIRGWLDYFLEGIGRGLAALASNPFAWLFGIIIVIVIIVIFFPGVLGVAAGRMGKSGQSK